MQIIYTALLGWLVLGYIAMLIVSIHDRRTGIGPKITTKDFGMLTFFSAILGPILFVLIVYWTWNDRRTN